MADSDSGGSIYQLPDKVRAEPNITFRSVESMIPSARRQSMLDSLHIPEAIQSRNELAEPSEVKNSMVKGARDNNAASEGSSNNARATRIGKQYRHKVCRGLVHCFSVSLCLI